MMMFIHYHRHVDGFVSFKPHINIYINIRLHFGTI